MQAPSLIINLLQFCLATAPPCWNFPSGATGAGGAGAGAGTGGAGEEEGGAGAGGSGSAGKVSREIPDHSSLALLKNVDFRYRPTTAPFRNKYRSNHCPVTAPTKKIIRGR